MKTTLRLFMIAFLFYSCTGSQKESSESTGEDIDTEISSGTDRYSYSKEFEMADISNLQVIRDWNNALMNRNFDEAFSLLADSITVYMSDGTFYNKTREEMRPIVEDMLGSMTEISVEFLAGIPLQNSKFNHTWVASFTNEWFNGPEGENNVIIHEAYRLEEGKIREVFQYAQIPAESDQRGSEKQDDPYVYSGSWVKGNPDNLGVIEGWIDAVLVKDWESASQFIGDTITIFTADGNSLTSSKEDLISSFKEQLQDASVELDLVSGVSVTSTVQQHDWLLIWGEETITHPDSTVNLIFHEALQLIDNKIVFVRQFLRQPQKAE